jgi:thiamine biosynthesis lipoprotein
VTVHIFDTMGTVASLHTAEPLSHVDRAAVEAIFVRYDRTYSLYDAASELSRVASGDIRLADTSSELRDTYALALDWRQKTGGLFTPHRPDDVIDLSGVVKALAIDEAGALLGGSTDDWLLTVGGDILGSRGHGSSDWSVGVVDPDDRSRLIGISGIGSGRRALATSGIAERGEHIWGRNGRSHYAQATVAADDIVTADVLATAIIAGTPDDLDRITASWDVDVLTVDRLGALRGTPGAAEWTRRCAAAATDRATAPTA